MKKTSTLETLFVFLIICIPILYTISVYPSLPKTIPIHFDLEGNANGFADKDSLWFIMLLMSGVSAGTYLLIRNLPKIDPKRTAGQSPELFHKIALVLVIFLCAISIMIVYASANGSVKINILMFPLLGLLFAILGNYMHSIKPNYFVGFRTPWTLENEDNWRKTHQLVGKIWVPGGLFLTISSLLLPAKPAFIVFITIVILMVVIPGIYSYLYYKKHKQS
jgi:uncharacterized membrane protein